ncbi:MAG TPA: NAD(P)-binding domain-containing protein, partial [Pyrinomonadaceae bacterium]|nr:NAD(P)-binding domain-containing protein [Pyrinomonadaceae bacterium]
MTQKELESTKLLENTKLAFIGCGVMGESIVAGLLRKKLVKPSQILASHPRQHRREELKEKYGIEVFEQNAEAGKSLPDNNSMIVLCVKPQRLKGVLDELVEVVQSNHLVISIIAGATIETLSESLKNDFVVRAMPNTPSQIGQGMTAWTCSDKVKNEQKEQVKVLLTALGKEIL